MRINDLPSVVKLCILDLYANDAALNCSHSDLHMMETFLQSDLDSVSTWLLSSHSCLNVDKSNCMLIGNSQIRSCVSLLVILCKLSN